MRLFDYDDSNIESVYSYAKKLEGMTFHEVLQEYEKNQIKSYGTNQYDIGQNSGTMFVKEQSVEYITKPTFNENAKGQLGNFIEKYFFGYDPNGNQEADFNKIGLELKQTPIYLTKKGEYKAGERLSITNISYNKPVEDDFYKSHVWEKIKCILLIHYLRDKSVERLDYVIKFVNLFTPPKEDLKIIIDDYHQINDKIKQGKAHELSEGDTMYLGACTKGATAQKSMRPQYYGDHILAKKRNYCFKVSYMNYVLKNYILQDNVPCDSIVKGTLEISLQEHVLQLINQYVGMTDRELCERFDRPYNNNKAQWTDLAFRMLGIKGNHAAEFEKGNIVVKTIRIDENGKNKENMSFAPFKFKELVQEEWENSTVLNYFETTQFLFVVFEKVEESYVLRGSQLWHMPYQDLNIVVHREWENYKNIIKNGVAFEIVKKHNGKIEVHNDLPGKSDTEIIHIRPHAQESAYRLHDGFVKGNVEKDADELPNGEWMTRQSFWLNREYVLKQIKVG